MSTEENKNIARRTAQELFNRGDLRIADELIAPDAVDHNEPPGTDCREHFKRVVSMLRGAFPDLDMRIDDMVAEGDKVAMRITMSGTHSGPDAFFGIPPSGKHFEVQQMRLVRLVNGQMTDSWAVIDMMGWMQQLGGMPAPGGGSGSSEAVIRGR